MSLRLIHPSMVVDGSYNTSIVSWVVSLKHAGVAQELALTKIQQLVKLIPGYEKSRSCRVSQLKCTVKSIYSNRRELYASKLGVALPDWLDISNLGQTPNKQKNSDTKSLCRNSLPGFTSTAGLYLEARSTSPQTAPDPSKGLPRVDHSEIIIDVTKPKIYTVNFKNRTGFFINNKLILTVIRNRHYKLTPIIKHIQENILKTKEQIDILRDLVHTRRNMKIYETLTKQLYTDDNYAVKAEQLCGSREYKSVSLKEWKMKKIDEQSWTEHLEAHSAPAFEYDESMFQEHFDL
jgi:hypothetical protein